MKTMGKSQREELRGLRLWSGQKNSGRNQLWEMDGSAVSLDPSGVDVPTPPPKKEHKSQLGWESDASGVPRVQGRALSSCLHALWAQAQTSRA